MGNLDLTWSCEHLPDGRCIVSQTISPYVCWHSLSGTFIFRPNHFTRLLLSGFFCWNFGLCILCSMVQEVHKCAGCLETCLNSDSSSQSTRHRCLLLFCFQLNAVTSTATQRLFHKKFAPFLDDVQLSWACKVIKSHLFHKKLTEIVFKKKNS